MTIHASEFNVLRLVNNVHIHWFWLLLLLLQGNISRIWVSFSQYISVRQHQQSKTSAYRKEGYLFEESDKGLLNGPLSAPLHCSGFEAWLQRGALLDTCFHNRKAVACMQPLSGENKEGRRHSTTAPTSDAECHMSSNCKFAEFTSVGLYSISLQ